MSSCLKKLLKIVSIGNRKLNAAKPNYTQVSANILSFKIVSQDKQPIYIRN